MLDFFGHWYLFGFLSRRLFGLLVVWLSSLVSAVVCFSSMRFLVVLSVSGFLKFSKNLNLNSKFGRHSFSVNFLISKVIFSQHELHFCFRDCNNFCSRLTSAISLYAQVQFHAKYPLFDGQSDREFTFKPYRASWLLIKAFYYIFQLVRALWLVNLAGRTPLYGPLKFKVGVVAKLFRDLSISVFNF